MTSTDLTLYDDSPTASALALVEPAAQLVERLANTSFVPQGYRGKPGELLAAVLTGHELGIGPMAAMSKIHNIQGRAGLSAELMRALPLSRGHSIWIEEASSTRVTVCGHRKGDAEHVSRMVWTIDMAKAARLDRKEVWRSFPQAMLLARATGDLCRAIFADCLSGISYTVEELNDGAFVDEVPEGGEVEATPEGAAPAKKAANTRKRPAAKKAAAAPAPQPPAEPAAPVDPVDEVEAIDAEAAGEKPDEGDGGIGDEVARRRVARVMARTHEVLGKDLDRLERLAFWSTSVGHPVLSGNDLTDGEVDVIVIDLDLIAADEQAWVGGEIVETTNAEIVDDGDGQAEAPTSSGAEFEFEGWTPEEWKKYRTDHGLGHAEFVRLAQSIEEGVSPSTLPQIVAQSAEFKAALFAKVAES